MVFASTIFLFWFLPISLILYFTAPGKTRLVLLSALSMIFYAWWRADFVVLMLISSVVDFAIGGVLPRVEAPKKRKLLLLLSLCVNLGLLGYFKYAGFGVESLNAILVSLKMEPITWTKVVLPVGISFYTFQSLSYTIDIYRRQIEPVKDFSLFLAYVSMFPQLVAGPIVRFRDIAEQLLNHRPSLKKFASGALLFQMGFAKKVLIADSVAPLADSGFAEVSLGFADVWLAVVAYTFQIYFDFSGYSDMAIGLGLMLGFVFPVNFNSPYKSINITDFWRRWHISLGAWLRDYLYISLGGNRNGVARMYFALAMTMLLGGLWHGASWTFVAWGAWQGLWLIVERANGKAALYAKTPRVVQIALTFFLACIGWVFFRAQTLDQAFHFIGSMIGLHGGFQGLEILVLSPLLLTGLVASAFVAWFLPNSQEQAKSPTWAISLGAPIFFLIAIGQLFFQQYRPFLYFQF